MTQIETIVFLRYLVNIVSAEEIPKFFVQGFMVAALFSISAVIVYGKLKGEATRLKLTSKLLVRMFVIGIVYMVIYILFGMFVAMPLGGEAFQSYYAGLHLPPWILPFQIVRGLIWAALALIVLNLTKLSWRERASAVAISMAGPLMTFFLALFGLILVYRSKSLFWRRIGFMLAIFNSLMAVIPNLMFFSWSGDLSWISYHTGIQEYSIRIPLTLFYLAVLMVVFKRENLRVVECVFIFFMTIVVIALNFIMDLVLWNESSVSISSMSGVSNPLFKPFFGIAFAVVLSDVFAFVAFLCVNAVSATITNKKAEK